MRPHRAFILRSGTGERSGHPTGGHGDRRICLHQGGHREGETQFHSDYESSVRVQVSYDSRVLSAAEEDQGSDLVGGGR